LNGCKNSLPTGISVKKYSSFPSEKVKWMSFIRQLLCVRIGKFYFTVLFT
jgi:hypothetical protein